MASKKGKKTPSQEPREEQVEAAESTAHVEQPVVPPERKVRLVNRASRPVYVPLADGTLRVPPKSALEVSEKDVSDHTRHAEREGRIVITIL